MTTSYIYYILVITVKFTEKIKNLAYLTPLYDWFGKRSFAQSGEDVAFEFEMYTGLPFGDGRVTPRPYKRNGGGGVVVE